MQRLEGGSKFDHDSQGNLAEISRTLSQILTAYQLSKGTGLMSTLTVSNLRVSIEVHLMKHVKQNGNKNQSRLTRKVDNDCFSGP